MRLPYESRKWVRPGVAVGNPRALTVQTPWRWMERMYNFIQAETMTSICLCMQGIATQLFRLCVRVRRCCSAMPKCACLRNGRSAKTLRRISASVHLVTPQELSHAINMIGKGFDRKGCKDLSGVNRTYVHVLDLTSKRHSDAAESCARPKADEASSKDAARKRRA